MGIWIGLVGLVMVILIFLASIAVVLWTTVVFLGEMRKYGDHAPIKVPAKTLLCDFGAAAQFACIMAATGWLSWLLGGYDRTGRYGSWLVLLSLVLLAVTITAFWLEVRYIYRSVRKQRWWPARRSVST